MGKPVSSSAPFAIRVFGSLLSSAQLALRMPVLPFLLRDQSLQCLLILQYCFSLRSVSAVVRRTLERG